MEEKINIAAILKDKKNGIRLYSPIFGECTFCCVREDTNDICVKKHNGVKEFFDSKGLYYNTGEVMLFPSKEMRDWTKFSWKKGDVLQNNDHSTQVIFDSFISDTYKMIRCKYWLKINNGNEKFIIETNVFTKEYFKVNEETRQCYINEIENRLCGKLNLETLEIEKQLEFKDGDIVVTDAIPSMWISKCIFILKGDLNTGENRANSYVFFNINNNRINYDVLDTIERDRNIHLATDSEKQQLFDAIEKDGKAWDAEKRAIVDLKPKVELKPFDRVLVRDFEDQAWQVSLFSYKDSDSYYCCNGCAWNKCISYIGNESLLGTTKDVEG